jgi:NTE family protein
LGKLIADNLNFSKIQENINSQVLRGLSITALDYKTSETITFIQGDPELPSWTRTRRRSERATIQVEHIIASSAIPVLFPPGAVGNRYFGDGCVRNLAPLSPAIHSGANQLLVIGVRRKEEIAPPDVSSAPSNPSIAKIINVLLNAILLDGIEVDLDRLARINEFIRRVPPEHQTNLNFKAVQYLFIQPSVDIGEVATKMASRMPRLIRYMLKGLGPLEDAKEIISYLLFESDFTNELIEIGYKDGMNAKEDILRFLLESQPQSLDWEGF